MNLESIAEGLPYRRKMPDIEGTVSFRSRQKQGAASAPDSRNQGRRDCSAERGSADAEIKRNLVDGDGEDPFIGVYTALATVYGRRMHSDRLISPPNLVHYPCLFPSRLARMEGASRNSKRGGGSWRLNEGLGGSRMPFPKIQTFLPSFFHSPRFPLPFPPRKTDKRIGLFGLLSSFF